jgi:hypothetical protein
MALGRDQEILEERRDYTVPFQTERGGVLSLTTLSGIQYAVYEANPSNDTVPLGIQQYDLEEVDAFRANLPFTHRRAYPENSSLPYVTKGILITNAVHPDIDPSQVRPGAPVYLAPSGTVTCAPTYCNKKIGTFQSQLNQSDLRVASLGASSLRAAGNEAIVNPQPATIPTAGWVKIRINL